MTSPAKTMAPPKSPENSVNSASPDTVWCTDIAYIWTHEGFVYLTSIMDLYARKIIAWTLSDSMDVSCVVDTINKAKAHRGGSLSRITHSARGSQHVSQAYYDVTTGIEHSCSHTGYPCNNAYIEAFHSLIKREWDYDHAYYSTHSQSL